MQFISQTRGWVTTNIYCFLITFIINLILNKFYYVYNNP